MEEFNSLSTLQLIGILAASLTVISFIVMAIKKLRAVIKSTQVELENIKTTLNQQQRFVFNKSCLVTTLNTSRVIPVDRGMLFILKDTTSGGFVIGKIFHNEVEVAASLNDLELIETTTAT